MQLNNELYSIELKIKLIEEAQHGVESMNFIEIIYVKKVTLNSTFI
jgi:hypothetical protein